MSTYRKEIEDWANRNYAKGYAYQTIIECWGDEHFDQYDSYPSAKAAIKAIEADYIDAVGEKYASATCDM